MSPHPGDGIAKENDDGTWYVYDVEPNGAWRLLEGPFGHESAAIARLTALVEPTRRRAQWVINRLGVGYTLN
jgi:hypothetical protein